MIIKIANAFNVSIDYLIGEGKLSSYDKEVLKRMEDIEQLDAETQKKLFFLIDNVECRKAKNSLKKNWQKYSILPIPLSASMNAMR